MGIRSMNFSFEAEHDHSDELKKTLISGIEAYVKTGRVVSEEKANAVIAAVEGALSDEGGRRRKATSGGRGARGRSRNKVARWSQSDFDALRSLDWGVLDPIWEAYKEGTIQEDADLKADQRRAIMNAYKEVPGDKRAERSEKANVIGRLKHLVGAYEAAEASGWK